MGHLLCPWASHLGATVIGTVSTEEKKRIALELGCHHVINYAIEDFVDRVREITNGEGVHVVYESIGKATLKRSLKCLRVRGMCAAYGHASGAWRRRASTASGSETYGRFRRPNGAWRLGMDARTACTIASSV
jgi:NADPH:quinone reductase-like Zn-dependent oxidoreductase